MDWRTLLRGDGCGGGSAVIRHRSGGAGTMRILGKGAGDGYAEVLCGNRTLPCRSDTEPLRAVLDGGVGEFGGVFLGVCGRSAAVRGSGDSPTGLA